MRIPVITLAIIAFVVGIAGSASASTREVFTASHTGVVTATTIRWHTDYVLRSDAVATIDLAFPLPVGTVLETPASVATVEREGRIVGFRMTGSPSIPGHVALTLREPLDRRGAAVHLAPPLAAGDAVQIVTVTGGDDLRFEPDARTLIERHVGFFAPADLAPSAREAADRAVGRAWNHRVDDPMYLQATPVLVADQGIAGTLSNGGDRARAGALWAGAIFVALVIGLALLQRKLARSARLEDAERILAAEFAALDRNEAP